MAEVIWTEPALSDLDAIADYIALDHPEAASRLVQKVFRHEVRLRGFAAGASAARDRRTPTPSPGGGRTEEQLAAHPKSGSKPPELKGWRYRQIVEPPCRVFYRHAGARVFILYVMRSERLLRPSVLSVRSKKRPE